MLTTLQAIFSWYNLIGNTKGEKYED